MQSNVNAISPSALRLDTQSTRSIKLLTESKTERMASATNPDSQSPKSGSAQSLGPSSESSTKQWDSDADSPAAGASSSSSDSGEEIPRISRSKATSSVFVVAGVLLVLDQITKTWAVNALAEGKTIDLIAGARFNLHFNPGAAFSTGTALGPLFGVAAVAVSIWLVTFAREQRNLAVSLVAGLIIGGALGNVGDRLFRRGQGGFLRGFVVDFIDLGWWPVFNVADMGIVMGVIAMMALLVRNPDL